MEIARVRDPHEVAVLVPYILGFHPGESLVLLALSGRRVVLTQRVDVVPPEHAERVVRTMLGHIARARAREVVAVAFEDAEDRTRPMVDVLLSLVGTGVVGCRACVVVRDGRCHDRLDPAPDPEGVPLPEPSRVPAVASFVAQGRHPVASRDALRARVEPGTDPRSDRVAAALSGGPGRVVRASAWRSVLAPAGGRRAGEVPADVPPKWVAMALRSLDDRTWRDALLHVMAPCGLDEEMLPPHVLAEARAAVPGLRGDPLLERVCALARLAPDKQSVGVLTMIAQLAWVDGDGALASVALERALAIDPRYRLALLLDQMVRHNVRIGSAA